MRDYLAHSFERCSEIFPVTNWLAMSMEQHEMLAAFRVRFSEFQEHLGKTMRAIAIEEEVEVERFSIGFYGKAQGVGVGRALEDDSRNTQCR